VAKHLSGGGGTVSLVLEATCLLGYYFDFLFNRTFFPITSTALLARSPKVNFWAVVGAGLVKERSQVK